MTGDGPHLILFDCDGTLVDSQHVIVAAMEAAFAACGLSRPERQSVLGIIGLSLPQAMRRVAPDADEATRVRLVSAYKEAFFTLRSDPAHHEPFFEGVEEVLAKLAADEAYVLGIATGKSRRGVASLFERTGIGQFFSTVQTADDAPSKPNPGMVLMACTETGIAPAKAVVIGDTVFDVEMAQAAGARSIAVGYGYHPQTLLEAQKPTAMVKRMGDVPEVLNAILAKGLVEGS